MTDSPLPRKLLELALELEPADRERLTPPDDVWAGIEAGLATAAPVSLDARRQRRNRNRQMPTWLLAAAAIVAIVGVIGAVVRIADDANESVVAAATIVNDGLQVPNDRSGEAQLVDVDGRYELVLDVPDLPDADGFYEVWIIDTEVEGMFSLGVVDGDGRYVLPDGVDPFDYPVVDISVEPVDGNPLHSGQSIWRGVLDAEV